MEESGWKLVHGDVFRPPQRSWLLTAFVGSGVQIFCMVVITLGECFLEVKPFCNPFLSMFLVTQIFVLYPIKCD